MPSVTLGFADRYESFDLDNAEGFPFSGAVAALEQARNASVAHEGVTDVWLFDSLSEAPWHASVALPPKGNRPRKP